MKTLIMGMLLLACVPVFAGEAAPKPAGEGPVIAEKRSPAKPPAKEKKTVKKAVPATHKITAAEIGKDAVCPVTEEKFKVSSETLSVSYKGKIYYFCCPACDPSFRADPEKYAVKEAPAKKQGKISVYVCPMGDYQGDKPGKCPKCGMDLVLKKQ